MTALMPPSAQLRPPSAMTQAGLVAVEWWVALSQVDHPSSEQQAQCEQMAAQFEHAWNRLTEEDRPTPTMLGEVLEIMTLPPSVWAQMQRVGVEVPEATWSLWGAVWKREDEVALHQWLSRGWPVGVDPVGFTLALIVNAIHWPGVWEAWLAHPQCPCPEKTRIALSEQNRWPQNLFWSWLDVGAGPVEALVSAALRDKVFDQSHLPRSVEWAQKTVQALKEWDPSGWEITRAQGGHAELWAALGKLDPEFSALAEAIRAQGIHPNTPKPLNPRASPQPDLMACWNQIKWPVETGAQASFWAPPSGPAFPPLGPQTPLARWAVSYGHGSVKELKKGWIGAPIPVTTINGGRSPSIGGAPALIFPTL